MKKFTIVVSCIFILLSMTGCWDQTNLNKKRIINGISFDIDEQNPENIQGAVRELNLRGSGGGQFDLSDEIIEADGVSVSKINNELVNKISGDMDISKAFLVLVGEDLAKQESISSLFEPIVRSKQGYLTSKVAITKGKASEILSLQISKSPIAFYILNLFENAEKETHIPKANTFTLWSEVVDKEKDAMIPYIQKSDLNRVELLGTALFKNDYYTGEVLSIDQTSLALFMQGKIEKPPVMQITNDNEKTDEFSVFVEKVKQKSDLTVDKSSGKVQLTIKVDLYGRLQSLAGSPKKVTNQELDKKASTFLTENAKEVTEIIKEAQSDILAIQKQLNSKYPDFLKNHEWEKVYKEIEITPDVNMHIQSSSNLK
ncbi:Ger(x)C family spore germination protein [Virgibacillus salexigens]|uniref:Spore germination protein A3 n=1 Tax=Virgibacillus massiliensis TaxID=1462526 RepID=A0A024QBM8_9BACI|nr:Ger(x)C family spore germination protein [Virgibacillus massiliensis]MYL41711.1 Ger(x)C family spore germination protein [Virgibacillus massiliensis]CDQ39600.1 Spore germination protein A3 precursor [Virgibacillus massiliensis]